MNPQTPTQLDPQAVAMAKAIRSVENPSGDPNKLGKSGEWGNYQFTKDTWNAIAPKYGVTTPWGQASSDEQNQVAYGQIVDWKNKGYNVGQVASMWNAGTGKPNAYVEGNAGTNSQGVKYDTQAYATQVATAYQGFKQQMGGDNQGQQGGIYPSANAAEPGQQAPQSPSVSGFVGNVFNSAGNLLGGLGQAALHPIQTVQNVAGMAAGGIEKLAGVSPNEDTQKFDALTSYLKQRYGGDSLSEVMGHIGNTLYTDPVGAALDLSTLIDGVGAAVGGVGKVAKIAELSKAADMLKAVSETINPIAGGAKLAKPVVNAGVSATRSIASHVFSLSDPATITTTLENYGDVSKAGEVNRAGLAEDFGQALDQLHGAVQEGGMAYGSIAKTPGLISVPENWISDVLSKGSSADEAGSRAIPFGLKLEPDLETGKLTVSADTTSFTRDPKALAAVQNFVDNWGNKTTLTPQEFLNMRSDLSQMSKFGRELGKNNAAELIAKALRGDANKMMRPNIPGLKTLDETQAPIIQQYNQAKKDFLTISPEGGFEFKPGAINKIANATGKGKDMLLQRMEQISPGITKRIQILRAVEDWESASKAKVGTYARGIIEGGGIITMNPAAIATAIIMNPAVALPILRGLGWSAAKMRPLIDLLKKVINTRTLKYPTEAGSLNQASSQTKPQAAQLPVSPPQ